MRRGKKIIVLVLFHVTSFQLCSGQSQHELDSLLTALQIGKEDTNKSNLLNHLASFYTFSDPQKSFEYSTKALLLSQKLNSKKYIIESYQNLSTYYGNTGDEKTAAEYIRKSIPLIEELGNKSYLCDAYGNLSTVAYYMNDYTGAFTYAEKALQLAYEINDSTKIAIWLNVVGLNYRDITADYTTALNYLLRSLAINTARNNKDRLSSDYYNIGCLYFMEKNSDKALENLQEALTISTEMNNQQSIGESLAMIGDIYYSKKEFQKAEEYYLKAKTISEKTDFFATTVASYEGLAKVYLETGKFDIAKEHLNTVLEVANKIGDKIAIATVFGTFSDVYIQEKKYKLANEYLLKALAIGNETDRKDLLKDVYLKLAQNNKLMHNYQAAYEFQNKFIGMNDSIISEQILKKTAELQARYETEKKDKEILSLNSASMTKDTEIKKQKILRNAFIYGLGMVMLLAVFSFNNFRTRNKLRLQNIRNKIASDLHDDIGSTLNSISVFSEVAKQKSPTVLNELDQIGDASRKIIDGMSDIVWTINTKNDSFEQIILRLRSITYNLLRAKNIEHTFRADESLNGIKLSMEARRNFYLIFKEALNNLVKYSNASRASISLTNENSFITLRIQDYGIGFDTNQLSNGNGLLNMKSRAAEMKAKLKIESEPGSGTSVELKLRA